MVKTLLSSKNINTAANPLAVEKIYLERCQVHTNNHRGIIPEKYFSHKTMLISHLQFYFRINPELWLNY